MALTGAVAQNGKQLIIALELWRDDVNAQWRPARPAGRARLLRRPEQSGERAGHLHQADHGRQSRSVARPLRHQHGGGRGAGDHGAQYDDDQHVGDRREPAFQLFALFRHDSGRPRRHQGVLARLLRAGGGAERRSRRPSRSSPPTPNSRKPPPTARATMPPPTASRSSTTRAIRRAPPILRRSCARCRRPIPTSSSSPPIRRIPSASCARRRRSG